MAWRTVCIGVVALVLTACGGDPAVAGADSDVSVLDTGGKEDSTSSGALTFEVIDAAESRILARLGAVPSSSLSSHLIAAAKRGVDVELYVVQTTPASPAKVIAAQRLEASGIHVIVDREDRCEYGAVVDDQLRTLKSTGAISTTKSKSRVAKAAKAFQQVLGRPPATAPRSIESGSVALRVMPDDTGADILDLIAGAATSIDLEIYQVEDPAVVTALSDAASRGVKVRVMLEPKTIGSKNYDAVAAELADAGVEVQPTPPTFDASGKVDHAKFMIVDGSGLAYGSGNLVCSGQGANPAWEFNNRDYWIEDGRPDVVAEAAALFSSDWNRTDTSTLAFESLVVTPDDAADDLLTLIDGAGDRLFVQNQSLNDPTILEHLKLADDRGVDVHVLLGLQPGYGGKPPANQGAVDELSAAGITAGYFSRHYLHAKLVIADDRAFVGSQNFTSGGLHNNRELGGIIDDAGVVGRLAQTFLLDEQAPTP